MIVRTHKHVPKTDKWCSERMALAIAHHFGWFENSMFEEVEYCGGRADAIFISRAGYVTEIEVKVSLSDWKADIKKAKWRMVRNVKFFYYAISPQLREKIPDGIPEQAGIACVTLSESGHYDRVDIIRAPKAMPAKPIEAKTVAYWQKCYYHRFMVQRVEALRKKFQYDYVKIQEEQNAGL